MRLTQKIEGQTSSLRRLKGELAKLIVLSLVVLSGCSLTATRPMQEMSYTSAAIRAAKEVQADNLAPETYRQANEWFRKARKEYRLKNFKQAKDYADKARSLAEQAEFDSIVNGGNREDKGIKDPLEK